MKETAQDILFRHYAPSKKGEGTYEVTLNAMKEIAEQSWEAGAKHNDKENFGAIPNKQEYLNSLFNRNL